MLLRGFLSSFIGTAVMTISSQTESIIEERGGSQTPGKAVSTLLSHLGLGELQGKRLSLASTWMHWIYGTAWGVVFWLLVNPEIAGLPLVAAGATYFAIVWLAGQAQQVGLGIAKPIWKYGAKATSLDVFHHLVYAAATTLAWWLIGEAQ